jgi:hypothetical protein
MMKATIKYDRDMRNYRFGSESVELATDFDEWCEAVPPFDLYAQSDDRRQEFYFSVDGLTIFNLLSEWACAVRNLDKTLEVDRSRPAESLKERNEILTWRKEWFDEYMQPVRKRLEEALDHLSIFEARLGVVKDR